MIAIADHVVDLGPAQEPDGGKVVYEGTVAGLRASGTLTGRHSTTRRRSRTTVRTPSGASRSRRHRPQPQGRRRQRPARRARGRHRRRGLGQELAHRGSVAGLAGVVLIDQAPSRVAAQQPGDLHRAARAGPQGLRQGQRRAPALFSANSKGACPTATDRRHRHRPRHHGRGRDHLRGLRGQAVRRRGARVPLRRPRHQRGARDVGDRGEAFFADGEARIPAAARDPRGLVDVGLGYLTLGQPLTTLSGGERQRLKLAMQLAKRARSMCSTSRPPACIWLTSSSLLALLDRLVDSGTSVIVIEHHQAVIAHADWVIDLGPGAGHDGGAWCSRAARPLSSRPGPR